MSNLTLDVGLAAKLKVAFARNGWTEQLIDAACEGDKLGQFRQVLLGHASITVVSHVIDCDADPFVPDGWSVEEHQKGGSFQWDASKVELWLANGQKNGEVKVIESKILCKGMAKKVPFNACILDYLLANPHLIPEGWEGKHVFFWGTVYCNRHGFLRVRCLYWSDDERWYWGSRWLGSLWFDGDPAAVRAS